LLWTVDAERNGDVQIRTLLKHTGHVRKDSFLNLPVRHDVNRFELVVGVESARYFRKVLARKRFSAGENQDAQVATQRLRNTFDLVRLHLEFLARTIVELVCKETVRAAHVANGSHQNVQQNWRERLADCQLRVPFK